MHSNLFLMHVLNTQIGAKDIYTEKFKDAEKETEKEVEEVEGVIKEAQNEHDVLKTFAEGADAPREIPPLYPLSRHLPIYLTFFLCRAVK